MLSAMLTCAMLFEHWYLGLISTVCQRDALIRPCIFSLLLSDQRLLPAHYHCLRASPELAVPSEIYLHEFPLITPRMLLSLPSSHGTVSAGNSTWEWICVQVGKRQGTGQGTHTFAEGSAA